jgi:hypothetical protein
VDRRIPQWLYTHIGGRKKLVPLAQPINLIRMAGDRPKATILNMPMIDIKDQKAESQLDALVFCRIYVPIAVPSLLRMLAPIQKLYIAPVYWYLGRISRGYGTRDQHAEG